MADEAIVIEDKPPVVDPKPVIAEDDQPFEMEAFTKVLQSKSGLVDTAIPKVKNDAKTTEDKTSEDKIGSGDDKGVSTNKDGKFDSSDTTKSKNDDTNNLQTNLNKEVTPLGTKELIPPDVAKQMSNKAREWATARAKEVIQHQAEIAKLNERLKDGPKELPASYLEHERAYTLSPEYQQSIGVYNQATTELNHWKNQLKTLRLGKDWFDLEGVDNHGNLIVGKDPQKPTVDAESIIEDYISNAKQAAEQSRFQASSIASNFKSRFEGRRSLQAKLEDEYFPSFADKAVVEKDPFINPVLKYLKDQGFDSVPPTTFAKLYSVLMASRAEVASLKESTNKATTLAKLELEAGPTSGDINSGKSAKKPIDPDDEPIDMDKFAAIRG